MERLFEALYNERRNAIPSMQGYEFQGRMALLRLLEAMVSRYEIDNSGVTANKLKLVIEWLEDFVLYDDQIKEIYQIKKTLKSTDRKEVLKNFIVQFKFLGRNDVKWILGYENTDLADIEITQTEFEQIYKEYIENEWLEQIDLLQKNYKDKDYWRENLKLKNSESKCKTIRAYIKKILEIEGKEYGKEKEREILCLNELEQIKKQLQKKEDDFENFKRCVEFQQVSTDEIDERCRKKINELFACNLERNRMMTEQDIFEKLYVRLYDKMMRLKNKKKMDNFTYTLDDIKDVFLDEDNSILRWKTELYRVQKSLLDAIDKDICNNCVDKEMKCSDCILHTISEWDMQKIIDNLNLEYASFEPKRAQESHNNKISVHKINLLVDIMEKFKMQLKIENNEILSITHQYAASTLVGGGRNNKDNINGILENYWEHSQIYRDYESVLTREYRYILTDNDISFLKEHAEEEQRAPLFNEIRNTKFIDYEEVEL